MPDVLPVKVEQAEKTENGSQMAPESNNQIKEVAGQNQIKDGAVDSQPITSEQIKISENGSNWNETEKWWDENKTAKKPIKTPETAKETVLEESDEEETVNIVQSEFT